MKISKPTDLAINVALPLALGISCYFFKGSAFMQYHLADGLWAYAFLSTLLIIWDRRIPLRWIMAVFTVAVAWEWAQFSDWVSGTGDQWDIVTYFIFFLIALLFNRIFFTTITTTHEK